MTPTTGSAGTGSTRRAHRSHPYEPQPLEYGARPCCRECGGQPGGTHTPRSER